MGILTLIKTLTASGSDYLDFVDGTSSVVLDSTYDEYMFVFTDINPATDNVDLQFQVNATDDAGGDYDTGLITSSAVASLHDEADGTAQVSYETADDLAQSALFQNISRNIGNGADESCAGIVHLFSPASTTYVKIWNSKFNGYLHHNYSNNDFMGGFIADATAIDEIRFKMSSGAFDGVVQLYGIS